MNRSYWHTNGQYPYMNNVHTHQMILPLVPSDVLQAERSAVCAASDEGVAEILQRDEMDR